MVLLLFYLFLALFVSFLCSIMEAVLLSTPLSFLNVKEEKGHKSAKVFVKLKNNIERPLTAILSLNTIAHTIGAAGVGVQATKIFGDYYFGLTTTILTLLILIFSEIIPKTLGARYWRSLALVSGIIIQVMLIITYPLVMIIQYLTRLFSLKDAEQTLSREEVSAMADIGKKEGIFDDKESRIIQNIIYLKNVKVSDIMTPRVVMAMADESMSLEEFLENKEFLHFSRIPVFSGKEENITGYVFRQAVFEKLAEDKTDLKLSDIRREIIFVPKSKTIMNLWDLMLEKKEHIAIIVDEYGGVDGLVTMEDIIETLIGLEIMDEKDKISDMQQYARERWNKRKAKYNLLDKSEKDTAQNR